MSTKSFSDLGLPDGHGFPIVAYHNLSGTIIVHTRATKGVLPSKRLFVRRVDDLRYTSVADFAANVSIDSFAVAHDSPVLYFTTISFAEIDHEAYGDWDALYQYFITDRRCEIVAREDVLKIPHGYDRVWPCELLSVQSKAERLFVTAAFQKGSLVEYYVAELNLSTLAIAAIARLEAVSA